MAQEARQEVITQALEFYLKIIKDEGAMAGLNLGKELVVEDSARIAKDIEDALRSFKTGTAISLLVTVDSRKEVLCDALDVYESGLKETREAYWKNVKTHPKLKSIDEAITVAHDLKKEFCVAHSV